MNTCPDCGAYLPEGMTCRDYYHQVMSEEYMVLSPRTDFLAAHKLTGVNYILQHPHEHTPKQLAFAVRLLEMVVRDGYFPLNAAETLQRQFAYHPPALDEACLPGRTSFPINIGNFRRHDEPYLDSAYRWSKSVFEGLGCYEVESETLHMTSSGM